MQKRCPRCGLEKSLEAGFYVFRDGRTSGWCRECVREDKRLRYARAPEVRARALEQATAYRAANKERLAEKQRQWEKRNEERRKAQRQARRASN